MSDLKLMHGTTGVYQTEYNGMFITVRLFEAVELDGQSGHASSWMAVNTYKCLATGVVSRVEHDILERAKVQHCREYAAKVDPSYGELFKAHMAHAYWRTIV